MKPYKVIEINNLAQTPGYEEKIRPDSLENPALHRASLVRAEAPQETLCNQIHHTIMCFVLSPLALLPEPRRDRSRQHLERLDDLVHVVVERRRCALVLYAEAERRDRAMRVGRSHGREVDAGLAAEPIDARAARKRDVPGQRRTGSRELEFEMFRIIESGRGDVGPHRKEVARAETTKATVTKQELANGR